MKDDELTPEQLANILSDAFPEKVYGYDRDELVAEQLDFLNKSSPGFGTVPLVGPDGADLGIAKFDFSIGKYVWISRSG